MSLFKRIPDMLQYSHGPSGVAGSPNARLAKRDTMNEFLREKEEGRKTRGGMDGVV